MNNSNTHSFRHRLGFTLAELLIVVAIIAVLVGISIPIFNEQLEKSRNATDTYNAQVIAHSIQIYYMSNPEALKDLQAACATGVHYVYLGVLNDTKNDGRTLKVQSTLVPALQEAGILGEHINGEFYSGMECKSQVKWKQYWVGVTTWATGSNKNANGEIVKVSFTGRTATDLTVPTRDGMFTSADPTGFRDLATGNS